MRLRSTSRPLRTAVPTHRARRPAPQQAPHRTDSRHSSGAQYVSIHMSGGREAPETRSCQAGGARDEGALKSTLRGEAVSPVHRCAAQPHCAHFAPRASPATTGDSAGSKCPRCRESRPPPRRVGAPTAEGARTRQGAQSGLAACCGLGGGALALWRSLRPRRSARRRVSE
jgi:hypothetical protein